jgi:P4 family phage/plasmid primase-like protien
MAEEISELQQKCIIESIERNYPNNIIAQNTFRAIEGIPLKEEIIPKQTLKVKKGDMFSRKGQAEMFIKFNPLFFDKSGMFWLWNFETCCWEIKDEVCILNSIEEHLKIDTINSTARNEIINSLKQVGRLNIPKPIKPTWIQFRDKIVDVITGEEIEASPEYFVTNPIPHQLHKEKYELTPVMDKIFEEWVGKENVKKLYEIIAYCLLSDYPLHRIFCFVGAGMNGKSKFLELLRKFVGDYNCCSTELDTLLTSRFEVTRLHKKLVCQMGETNFEELSKTSTLKKLSGGDLIGYEYKGKTPFEDKNYAKIIISTNNLPTTTDKTIGFYRRWMIIDFPNTFSEKKEILGDIPEEEYESLALKSCILLKDLLSKREFHNEGSVEERMERYEARSNFLEKFINTYTEQDIESYITVADFHKKFSSWSKENRHRDMSETTLGMAMKKLGIEQNRKYFDWLYDGKGGQARCWIGLKWK